MKNMLIPVAAILLASCGSEENATDSNDIPSAVDSAAAADAATPAIAEASQELPWGVPIMPGARYISGSTEFSRTTEKRGGEAVATIAVRGSVADIIGYYETALPDAGFQIIHNKILDESSGSVHGENDKGEQFRVTAMRGGSNANEGESTAAMLAVKPKLAPGQ